MKQKLEPGDMVLEILSDTDAKQNLFGIMLTETVSIYVSMDWSCSIFEQSDDHGWNKIIKTAYDFGIKN